jgi:RNA polymerase sigma factor (sigma-70 family)
MSKKAISDKIWDEVSDKVINNIKVHLLKNYVNEILHFYSPKIDGIVRKYSNYLPRAVSGAEGDDLKTIANLEFLETLKVWDPSMNENVWPLAYSRIMGAMKDHIRYVTRSDPSRLYDWINDAAQVILLSRDRADFQTQIETGVELNRAMEVLSFREKKVVTLHTKDDLTFKQIGERLGVSESQVSRIYKKCIEKIKKVIHN